jgi:hypothetical protein
MMKNRPDVLQKGSPGPHTRIATVARREVEVEEGEFAKGEELRVARGGGRDLNRYAVKDSNCPLGLGEGSGKENGVASSCSSLHNRVVGGVISWMKAR